MANQTSKQDIDQVFNRTHCRNKYENFNEEQKMVLLTWFKQNPYPKTEEYELIAKEIDKPRNKIQNWFKYHRRLSALESEDKMPQYKSKNVVNQKVFAKLKEYFKQNQNPSIKELRELSKLLNLKETQINSWFTYRRRKLRLSQNLNKKSKKIRKTFSTTAPIQENVPIPTIIEVQTKQLIDEMPQKLPMKQEYSPYTMMPSAKVIPYVKQEQVRQFQPQIPNLVNRFPLQKINFYKSLLANYLQRNQPQIMRMNNNNNNVGFYQQQFSNVSNASVSNANNNNGRFYNYPQMMPMVSPKTQLSFNYVDSYFGGRKY